MVPAPDKWSDLWLNFYFVVSFVRESILVREEPVENPQVTFKSISTELWRNEKRSFVAEPAESHKKCFRSLRSLTSLLGHRLQTSLVASNSYYYSYQRFWLTNEANGSFLIVLTLKPRFRAVVNKRSFVCGLNCNNSYYSSRWSEPAGLGLGSPVPSNYSAILLLFVR